MTIMITKSRYINLLLGLLLGLPALLHADDSLLPVVPEAQQRVSETQGCVEPTEEMRRNHMEYILHQRDETMHRGIRTRQYSIEECINCHVSGEPDGPRYGNKKHFCSSCHSYAAVSIDCFQCHRDRPESDSPAPTGMPGGGSQESSYAKEQPVMASGDDTNEQ